MKIRQETLPLPVPVMDPTGDIEVHARRVAALESRTASLGSICASLMWSALTRHEKAERAEGPL